LQTKILPNANGVYWNDDAKQKISLRRESVPILGTDEIVVLLQKELIPELRNILLG